VAANAESKEQAADAIAVVVLLQANGVSPKKAAERIVEIFSQVNGVTDPGRASGQPEHKPEQPT
jgi:hypothetical protein